MDRDVHSANVSGGWRRRRRRLVRQLPLLLVAGVVLLLLCAPLAGAGRLQAQGGPLVWVNGVDVVGSWGWSVGTDGLVVHWARVGGVREVWSLAAGDDIQAIDMVSAKIGYLATAGKGQAGRGAVFKTTDGGRHWSRKYTAAVDVLTAVKFRSTTLGWVAGRGGTVLKTTNGGKTWTKLRTGTTATLYGLSFPSDKVGYAVGAGGMLIKTVNAGKTWKAQDSWTAEALYGVDFVSTTTGYVVGGDSAGYCARTTDGGRKWYAKGSSLPPLVAVDFVNASNGWVLGNEGAWPDLDGKIIKVTGGGAAWTDQSATVGQAPPDYALVALKVVDATHAYAGGERGASLYTDDGKTWHLTYLDGL